MDEYQPPESELTRVTPPGVCPACGNKISYWAVARPTLVPNRLICNHCGEKLKYLYGPGSLFFYNVLAFLLGILACFLVFGLVWHFELHIGLIGVLVLVSMLCLVFTIGAGYLEAIHSSRYRELVRRN